MGKNRTEPAADYPASVDLLSEAAPPMPPSFAPDLPTDLQADPEVERLRRELAARDAEIHSLRTEAIKRDAASQPLPDDGPGEYEVIVRHTPATLKRFRVEAKNAQDAWSKFCVAAVRKAYNQKDPHQRAMKQVEQWLRDGARDGFQRSVKKIVAAVAA